MRWDTTMRAWIAFALVACSTPQQARWGTRGESTCPQDRGCELAIGSDGQYAGPDDDWVTPDPDLPTRPTQPSLTPRKTSCAEVGLALATLEIGNYADAATRAPAVREQTARCAALRLDREERACVYTSHGRDAMAYCAPRLFPGVTVQVVDPANCSTIIDGIRTATKRSYPGLPDADARMAALAESCRRDRWTVQYATCAKNAPVAVTPTYCQYQAPAFLQTRVAARLAAITASK